MISSNAENRTVLVEKNGPEEHHNFDHLVIGSSKPPVETKDDEYVIDGIVGHTQGSALEREYRFGWLGYTQEEDTSVRSMTSRATLWFGTAVGSEFLSQIRTLT